MTLTDSDSTKRCTKCGETKDLAEFPKDKRYKGGRSTWCRACKNVFNKRWREKNPESTRESQRKWRAENPDYWKTPEWRQRFCKYAAKYRERHAEKVAKRSRDYQKRNARLYAKISHDYRARKAGAYGTYTLEQERAMYDFYNHTCLCCGWRGKLTFDHVVPLSKGGQNTILNAQPLCGTCNSRKGNRANTDYRNLAEFMEFVDQLKATGLLRDL